MAHHGKNTDKYADVDTDHQLKKVSNILIFQILLFIIFSQGPRICK